ncbi:major facilitator superfamily transporter [Trichoderma gamsii]|nr:major facilitator superfamily transporter [Trichoderma gamsii]PON25566.1 major facilitator superfamily transporter [Trichoderma gamsii]
MSGTTPERKSEDITSAPRRHSKDEEEARGHNLDHEKHEYSTTLSDSDNSSTIDASERSAPGVSISRTVSEVRDGIANQRDLERGDDAIEKTPTVRIDDPNVVKWTGPDDPENPKNWLLKRKWAAVFCVSCFTLISPVASSMVAPGLPQISKDLHITEEIESALVLSIFVAAYALGPLMWGPLSELYGRTIILQISNLWFLLFNLGCGLARTEAQMFVFRFLAGIGGSAPLAIGGGVLGDLFNAEQRGKAMSIYSLMPLLGPALGPIAGGWVTDRTTWRWVFYSTTIACGVIQTAGVFFLQETYAPVLLQRKKKALMKETGNTNLVTEYDRPDRTVFQTLTTALTRPFRLLVTQPIVQIMSLYMMFLYGVTYLVLSTFASLWANEYHESPGIAGLNYISLGLGFFLGAQICAPLQDRIYAALKRRYVPDGGPGRPEFRVPMLIPGAILLPIGILIYSWTAEAHTHWIGPNIGAVVFGASIIIGFQCTQGYIVDSYTRYAASAISAVTVLRSLAGFGFPLFAPAMYNKLGYGIGGTVLAAVAIGIGWPSPIFLWFYGPKLRAMSKFAQ